MRQRSGAVLVWFALLLPVLFGITGLVIDTGLMLATHRQLQNSADAAALAAAVAVIQDPSVDIQQIANEYVTTHYGFDSATVTAQFAETGMYAGTAGFVEVSAEYSAPTIFMHLLSGGAKQRRVSARAVAGGEEVEILDGIIALNPGAVPGVAVTGNAELNVTGRVIANSEGGGVDGDGAPIDNGSSGSSAFASGFGWMRAREVYLVGGANRSDRFENIEPGGPNPLRTGQLPVPDPMINLPTPTVENGVVNIRRGAPKATNGTLQLNNEMDQTGSANFIETDCAKRSGNTGAPSRNLFANRHQWRERAIRAGDLCRCRRVGQPGHSDHRRRRHGAWRHVLQHHAGLRSDHRRARSTRRAAIAGSVVDRGRHDSARCRSRVYRRRHVAARLRRCQPGYFPVQRNAVVPTPPQSRDYPDPGV